MPLHPHDPTRLERLARFSVDHPVELLVRALAVSVVVIAAFVVWHGDLTDGVSVPGSDSQHATEFERKAFPERLAATAEVVLVSHDGPIDTPARRDAIEAALSRARTLRGVAFVENPWKPALTSHDGLAMIVEVQYDPSKVDERSVDDLRRAFGNVPGVVAEIGGTMPEIAADPSAGSETVGFLAAMVVLLVVFGSVIAAGLPLLLSTVSLAVGVAGVLLIARVADVSSLAPQLAATIGLGVGIDYALLIITRSRELVAEGRERREAIVGAVTTAGHSVLVAGATVVVSICGLFLTGIEMLAMMGVATALCVLVTVVANLTVLPALLSLLGDRIDAGRLVRRRSAAVTEPRASSWVRWSTTAMRRPVAAVIGSVMLLAVLAAPVVSLEIGYADASVAPLSNTARRAYDATTRHFGVGWNTSLEAVTNLSPGDPGRRGANAERLRAAVAADPGVAAVMAVDYGQSGEQAAIRFFPTTGPQAEATRTTVNRLREDVLPAATRDTGTGAWIGGTTATRIDFAARVQARLPWFVGAVVLVSVIVLTLSFRAPVVALKAATMNLLSIAAAYGVVVAVFQWGWGGSILGVDEKVPIDAYVPVFLFAILFGLSMDYEVFILARIRERYELTGDNDAAIIDGIAGTARVVTSAAFIMLGVFASFLFGGDSVVKMFGVGLTTAIVVDVTIVRLFLLPATMKLLGPANWWAPRWMRRREPTRRTSQQLVS